MYNHLLDHDLGKIRRQETRRFYLRSACDGRVSRSDLLLAEANSTAFDQQDLMLHWCCHRSDKSILSRLKFHVGSFLLNLGKCCHAIQLQQVTH